MKFTTKIIVIVGLVATLMVGCTTREEVLYSHQKKCLDYGFVYGTDEFAHCMLKQERMAQEELHHYDRMVLKRNKAAAKAQSAENVHISGHPPELEDPYISQPMDPLNTSLLDKASYGYYSENQPLKIYTTPRTQATDPAYYRSQYNRSGNDWQSKQKADRQQEQIRLDQTLARKLQADENARAARLSSIPVPPPPPLSLKHVKPSSQSFAEELAAKVAEREGRLKKNRPNS